MLQTKQEMAAAADDFQWPVGSFCCVHKHSTFNAKSCAHRVKLAYLKPKPSYRWAGLHYDTACITCQFGLEAARKQGIKLPDKPYCKVTGLYVPEFKARRHQL